MGGSSRSELSTLSSASTKALPIALVRLKQGHPLLSHVIREAKVCKRFPLSFNSFPDTFLGLTILSMSWNIVLEILSNFMEFEAQWY